MNLSSIDPYLTPIAVIMAFIALVIYIIATFILDYHLRRYITIGMRPLVAFARVIYFGVSVISITMICMLVLSLFSPQ
jgi:hypothetical protein